MRTLICATLFMALPAIAEPLVIAHRGASAVAPENTVASIREALRLGAKVIEFDVRTTSDEEMVLFHDDELSRLVGRPDTIETLDWATVQTLDVGKWFSKGSFIGEAVPRFADAVKLVLDAGATPLIEHKTGDAADYARVIRSLAATDRVIVQSFDWKFLAALRQEIPEVKIGALGSKEFDEEKYTTLSGLRPDWVAWKQTDFLETDVPKVRTLGAKLALWTVNDPDIATLWLKRGADGIITDVPDVIGNVVKRIEAE
mgnify:CR=1 FL=1